jgi:hypothetical protein
MIRLLAKAKLVASKFREARSVIGTKILKLIALTPEGEYARERLGGVWYLVVPIAGPDEYGPFWTQNASVFENDNFYVVVESVDYGRAT